MPVDAQIVADLMDGTTRTQTSQNMHARLEGDACPTEGLQSATYHGILLEHRHLVTFLRK